MLWACSDCTTGYSVGAPSCPHCGSTDYVEEGMAKITKHGGPSDATVVVAAVVAAAAEVEPEVVEPVQVEESDVPVAPGQPYDTWLLVDLQEELAGRDLPKSGNKADLVQRLIDDDEAESDGFETTDGGDSEVEPVF